MENMGLIPNSAVNQNMKARGIQPLEGTSELKQTIRPLPP